MNVEAYVQSVRADLASVAAVGDESTARAAELLSTALEPSLERRLQEALVEAALALSAEMERGTVEVRISGDDLDLVYLESGDHGISDATDEAFSARITLRLPESLKTRLEAAASARAISLNTWIVQALARSLEQSQSRGSLGRHRLTGYGRS
ncbi:MAG TPA: toxin-antitoxin system HicB family antitoxin [Solirubrobacteraceae bacterium]|jgi:predicted DNA binding CopG/RHH family protein